MPVCKYLDLSTGHLPARDREKLDDGPCPAIVVPHPYGWWIHVPSDDDELDDLVNRNTGSPEQVMSDDFIALLMHARECECDWINLDQDADQEVGLPWFGAGEEPVREDG